MEEFFLEAMVRQDAEIRKNNLLRKQGFVPCVVYGEGHKTLSLKIERSRLIKFMHAHHGGENLVITLKISSQGKETIKDRPVIIQELQTHPVSGDLVHVDFHEVSLTKRLIVEIPIEAKGDAVGVKQDGGTLEHILWEVEVECLPTKIPEKIEVDVTNMKIGETIHVKDLVVPADVVIKHDLESIVFTLVPPHKEELPEEGEAAEAVSAEPEVIKKEKKPVEEVEGGESKGA
ncbi:MAG: 50S ribosomal protein L25 [Candidatus Omnitrophota bacterium]